MPPSDRRNEYLLHAKYRLTPAEVEAALLLRDFARHDLGIELHVGQLAYAGLVLARDPIRLWSAKYLTILLSAGNRAGKTMLMAILIIYSCIRKLNHATPSTDAEALAWLHDEYQWYHFGISQEVADLVFNEIVRIFAGTHGAQRNGCPITKSGPVADTSRKEYGEYHWVVFRAEWGGAQIHFRTTGEKALGQLGKDMDGISFDEAGIERNLPFLVKEVFDFRRLGTGGQLLMASTPSEALGSDFADMWDLGDPESEKRKPSYRSIRMSTRSNIGYGLDQVMFDRLTADMDERTIRQNVEGEFLQAKGAYFNGENVELVFVAGMPERSPARKGGLYLQGLDPAKSVDSAWSIVLKLVPNREDPDKPYLVGVRCEQKSGQKSTEALVALAADAYNAYGVHRLGSQCYTALDATGFGGKMFKEAIEGDVPNLTNIEFGGTIKTKRMLLGDLRTMIDEGRLLLPREGAWLQVRKQLMRYRLDDSKLTQDAVMALCCAVALIRRTPLDGVTSAPFSTNAGF